ncbi:MAG: hypothetical protein ABIO70_35010 [Pseudomonadota bacterium]
MLRRMMLVALILGVPSALADGFAVAPTMGAGLAKASPMMSAQFGPQMSHMGGQMMYKALMFSRSVKYSRPAEKGDITF